MYFQGPSMPHLYLYPWKLCLVKFELDIHVFDVENLFWFAVSLKKWLTHFFLKRMTGEIKNFNTQKNDISFHIFWLDFGFKCIVVNRTLHGGSLEIALTSPLIIFLYFFYLYYWIIQQDQGEEILGGKETKENHSILGLYQVIKFICLFCVLYKMLHCRQGPVVLVAE